MTAGFFCPHCEHRISDPDAATIAFYGYLHGAKFRVGSNFTMSSDFGKYGAYVENEGLEIDPGAKVEFCCPHEDCRKSLTSHYNDSLAEIVWRDESEKLHHVAFSRVAGKEMTFVIDVEQGEVIAAHGRDRLELLSCWDGYLAGPLHRL